MSQLPTRPPPQALRIARWIFAIVALIPISVALVVGWWLFSLNWHPPRMVAGEVAVDNRRDRKEVSRDFTALLQQKFPVGTDEFLLKSQLFAQGFARPTGSGPADCQPPVQVEPIGMVRVTCSYPINVLEYHWTVGLICGSTLSVKWATDDRAKVPGMPERPKIVRVAGEYSSVCL
jgi:hypothetical protein